MNLLLQNFLEARDALYEHYGFKKVRSAYPSSGIADGRLCRDLIKRLIANIDELKKIQQEEFNREVRRNVLIKQLIVTSKCVGVLQA
jgi:hypothetical protein